MINKLRPKSEFGRNVLTLMTGTTIAQAIPIAISPILTRIYTPEDFGVFALYMSIASILSVVATGRYELAIMLPKKDKDAINIVVLSILISFFVSFLSFFIVWIFNTNITNLLGSPEISNWLYFIPVTVLLTGLYQSFNYWSNRKKLYKRLALSRVTQSGTTATVNLVMGFNGFNSSGLIFGGLIGQGIATTILGKFILKEDNYIFKYINQLKMIALAKKYIKFPKYEIWSGLSNRVSSQAPVILLASFFNTSVTGFYSLAYRILTLPMSLIGSSIGQVFLQESSKIRNDKIALRNLTKNTFIKLFILGLLPMSFIGVYGDYIFLFVFGQEWIVAGQYAQILSIWLFLVFLGSPLSTLFITLEKQKEFLIFNIAMLVSRITVLIVAYYIFNDALYTILLYTLVGTLFWIGLMIYILKLSNMLFKEIYGLIFLLIILNILLYIIRIYYLEL